MSEEDKKSEKREKLPPLECNECGCNLRGSQYVEKDDKKYCVPDHEKLFCNTCVECDKIIGVGQRGLSYGDKHFHEGCFVCFKCGTCIAEIEFDQKDGNRYCENCLEEIYGKDVNVCPNCTEKLRRGQKKMQYREKHYHEKCFVCIHCKKEIGTESFYPKPDGFCCRSCHDEQKRKKAEAEAYKGQE